MSGKCPKESLSATISRVLSAGQLIELADRQPTKAEQQRVLAQAMEVLKPYASEPK